MDREKYGFLPKMSNKQPYNIAFAPKVAINVLYAFQKTERITSN